MQRALAQACLVWISGRPSASSFVSEIGPTGKREAPLGLPLEVDRLSRGWVLGLAERSCGGDQAVRLRFSHRARPIRRRRRTVVIVAAIQRAVLIDVAARQAAGVYGMRRVPVRIHLVQRLVHWCRPGRVHDAAAGVPAVMVVCAVSCAGRGVAAGDDVAYVEAAPGKAREVAAVVEG